MFVETDFCLILLFLYRMLFERLALFIESLPTVQMSCAVLLQDA